MELARPFFREIDRVTRALFMSVLWFCTQESFLIIYQQNQLIVAGTERERKEYIDMIWLCRYYHVIAAGAGV